MSLLAKEEYTKKKRFITETREAFSSDGVNEMTKIFLGITRE